MYQRLAFLFIVVTLFSSIVVAQVASGSVWMASALTAILCFLVTIWLIRRHFTQPLDQFSHVMRRRLNGKLQARMLPDRAKDVRQVVESFNQLQDADMAKMQALVVQHDVLDVVFQHMTDGVIVVDQRERISQVNEMVLELLDSTRDEIIGRTVAEVVRHHQIIELWQRCTNTHTFVSEVVDMGQQGLFLQVNITPIQEVLMNGYLILLSDLTKVRRLETVRRDFISNISHELRTPIASVKAVVETLQDGALEDPPAAQRFLSRAATEIDVLSQMVEELLELSRIESGKVPFRFEVLAIHPLVQSAVTRLTPQANRAGLMLAAEIAPDLPNVMIDEPRVEQVLNNLLHNAVKFTPEEGKILVRVSAETNPNQPNEQVVRVVVKDSGIGIPRSEINRIFERFYKSDRARTGRGTGLGLAIAKHIVLAHGGDIWAESKEGKGSSFIFTLPAVQINQRRA